MQQTLALLKHVADDPRNEDTRDVDRRAGKPKFHVERAL